MTEPRLRDVQCLTSRGLHRMAYWEWGDAANPRVVVCVHGLARQGRDFDVLARALSEDFRVVCPDVVGRGRSAWLADPMLYQVPTYVADMVTLLARLDVPSVHWVGTSMGGLIGMGLAASPDTPIGKLVLNDVGPAIQASAIARIATYLGRPEHWATLDEAADGAGRLSREQWRDLTRPMLRPNGEGFKLHYDPAIAEPVRAFTPEMAAVGEAMLWHGYDHTRCPTLLLRGAESDLLTAATAQAMTQRGPRAQLREFAGVGHAPMLVEPEQVAAVREFLLAP
jgi:pimeloyl-ACP methyl ester carboxylesterase